jgi:LacI family transcriptional regulator
MILVPSLASSATGVQLTIHAWHFSGYTSILNKCGKASMICVTTAKNMRQTETPTLLSPRKRVALLIESFRAYGRGLLRGIARYARASDNWSITFVERSSTESVPDWLDRWTGDGVIARVEDHRVRDAILARNVPAVDLRGLLDVPFPVIETDDYQVAEQAFKHLTHIRLTNFAYCGFENANFSDRRLAGFRPLVERLQLPCHVHLSPSILSTQLTREIEQQALLGDSNLSEWLEGLPKPIGIMACNDVCGQMILNACRELHISVPDEIAVIGVDNDEVHCELTDPPLTSVEPDTDRIGYLAATLLDSMMNGDAVASTKMFVSPKRVVSRRSTETLALDDSHVSTAMRIIREQACLGLDVNGLVEQLPLSRRSLERRFRECLDSSPAAEIVRVRIARLKRLLRETDLPLQRIAQLTGFDYVEHMHLFFKKHIGMPPGKFRKGQEAQPES